MFGVVFEADVFREVFEAGGVLEDPGEVPWTFLFQDFNLSNVLAIADFLSGSDILTIFFRMQLPFSLIDDIKPSSW